ncbi:hypothetical protein L6R50_01945 [Myxococcota bacterium]|nr:hypothetical protein [Myxococcota bacterium]
MSDGGAGGEGRRGPRDRGEVPSHSGSRREFRLDPARGRFNPYVARLSEYPGLILTGDEARSLRGRWAAEGFDSPGDVWLEIGPGNGFFLSGMAALHPERRFVGVEIRYKRVWMTAKKLHHAAVRNARVVHFHAGFLPEIFAPGELSGVFVNHPDPWPKDRQQKHRLFNPDFAAILEFLVRPGGELRVKSDFAPYVPAVRDAFAGTRFAETAFTPDINRPGEPLAAGDVVTNYQRKFIERGLPVFFMSLRRGA